MTGFEPRTSGIGSDRSTNWATTTAQHIRYFIQPFASSTYAFIDTFTYFMASQFDILNLGLTFC